MEAGRDMLALDPQMVEMIRGSIVMLSEERNRARIRSEIDSALNKKLSEMRKQKETRIKERRENDFVFFKCVYLKISKVFFIKNFPKFSF